ncbi:hypothetical protein P153DRAFT_364080 [Dothidotthia symphoricarpi CBS 119687]|uniref:Uncharacterized protein n=1 Tax=Dothidotthia symphoricarpi CBS 119687 TaxID=1392245 RepID=A0A6A6ANP6_9PLEO|nr:uncharacterized protein P153DRAFT_364080 [Dothidotthia symphoricarpi CBS 119687]KAF2132813.1 hypothetical protein P153DRAFT_364080 [Dothidotthia symphoricarpi CBS 119687]
MESLHRHTGQYPALRPNVYETRLSSDAQTPEKKHKSKTHRHRHHDSHHRHGSRHRDRAKDVLQPPTSFGDLLNKARGSKEPSPTHSRKGSIGNRDENGNDNGKDGDAISSRRPVRLEDVEREGRRVEARERSLRTALQSLSDKSLKTSRRLDDTYYSILEKVSALRQTIGMMQELSGLTRELHTNFETDAEELVEEVKGQYDGFDKFEVQQEQVTALEERIRAGREKADALTRRLADAKEKVDKRAEAEAQWEARTSRHLHIFWGILASITAFLVLLMLFHHLKPNYGSEEPDTTLDFATRAKLLKAPIPDMAKEDIIGLATSTPDLKLETPFAAPATALEEDVRLRVFDEL